MINSPGTFVGTIGVIVTIWVAILYDPNHANMATQWSSPSEELVNLGEFAGTAVTYVLGTLWMIAAFLMSIGVYYYHRYKDEPDVRISAQKTANAKNNSMYLLIGFINGCALVGSGFVFAGMSYLAVLALIYSLLHAIKNDFGETK